MLAMLETVLESSLTRKQFLLVIGSLLLSVLGINQLLQNSRSSYRQATSGFSSGTYGGK